MYTKFDKPLVYKFYEEFDRQLKGNSQVQDIDKLLKLILMNNGVGMADECKQSVQCLIEDELYVYYLYGAKANESNEYFDYIDFYGTNYLVIFMDYFEDIVTQEKIDNEQDNITKIAMENLGNSVYFDAIVKLVEIFTYITNPITKSSVMLKTAASQNIRYISHIIAGKIINQFKTLTEADIDNIIALDELNELIDGEGTLLKLIGIRKQ